MTDDIMSLSPIPELPEPSERVRLRELFGVSQTTLGKSCGVGRKTVYAWEHGLSVPTGRNRARYASILTTWARQESVVKSVIHDAGEVLAIIADKVP